MVILHLLSSRGAEPDDMRRKFMVIRTPLCHPETIESGGTQRKIMVILHLLSSRGGEPDDMRRQIMVIRTPFRHPETIESDGTQRQIMVILRLLSSRGGEPNDMWRQIMVIPHLFVNQRQASPLTHRDKLWSFCTFCHPEAPSPMTCGENLW